MARRKRQSLRRASDVLEYDRDMRARDIRPGLTRTNDVDLLNLDGGPGRIYREESMMPKPKPKTKIDWRKLPRVPLARKRDHHVMISMTADEHEALRTLATNEGLPLATYVHRQLFTMP